MKGQRDAKDAAKADTMSKVWIPAVNNAGRYGRWAFLELTDIPYDIEDRLRAFVRAPAMARRAKRRGPASEADVESYKHEAKRKNIPTAENQKLVADEDKTIRKLCWKRNPDLDPQLVWRGKDFESDPLEVDAPPIYIQAPKPTLSPAPATAPKSRSQPTWLGVAPIFAWRRGLPTSAGCM